MVDILGYSRNVYPNGQLASSEWATLRLGGVIVQFLQEFRAQYGQKVISKFEIGSPNLYYITGQPEGNITWGRNVGRGGFLDGLSAIQNSCGRLISVGIGLDGNGGCSTVANPGGQGINFGGGVAESVQVGSTSGSMEITESGTIRVAAMSLG